MNGAGLDNITIKGAGTGTTIVEPNAGRRMTRFRSSAAQDAIVDVNGATGVTIKGLTVNGGSAQSSFTDCSVGYDGVYFHNASGTLSKVDVTGVDLPGGHFGASKARASMSPLMPARRRRHHDQGRGHQLRQERHHLRRSGNDLLVSGSTTAGDGPITTMAQNGIQVYGSSATLTRDTVSSISYTGGTYDVTGILVINAGSFSLTNDTMSPRTTSAPTCSRTPARVGCCSRGRPRVPGRSPATPPISRRAIPAEVPVRASATVSTSTARLLR